MFPRCLVPATLAAVAFAAPAAAQPLGIFSWQLQPYCNVVTLNVTGVAGVYTLEGSDDQCDAGTRAPVNGVATPNPDGSIGFGLTIVTSPGGRPVHVSARVSTNGFSGPWSDSEGHTGTFAFNAHTGGDARPLPTAPASPIPPSIGLRSDGGFVAGGAVGVGEIPAEGAGARMMWFPSRFAFRAGGASQTSGSLAAMGSGSAAFGLGTVASGGYTLATGYLTRATDTGATATGYETEAAGVASFATGSRNRATGSHSFVAGHDSASTGYSSFAFGNASASGEYAAAIGSVLDAAGDGSIALGTRVTTTIAGTGSFVFGDRSTTTQFFGFQPNQFRVRAAGGTFFFSNPGLTAGVQLAAGANAWSSLSDVNSKEHFRDLDGGDVLAKIAAMPIREWNYKAQDAAIRHVGPTAQDFHAAFGLGEDELRISTIDADGIALRAIQALIEENRALKARMTDLELALGRK